MAPTLASLKGRRFLLGVGAQKAGTTWLYYYLQSHPEVCISPVKEMHFFGNRDVTEGWPVTAFRKKLKERQNRDLATSGKSKRFNALQERIRMDGKLWRYRRFFRKRVADELVFGEITPAYSKLPVEELEFIRDEFPDTRVIFLMRNPADRLWSQMRFSENFETLEEMESAVDRVFGKRGYQERIDYAQTIINLREVFDEHAVHFEFYENLFTPKAVDQICDFLSIKAHPAKFERTHNVSVKMPLGPDTRADIVKRLQHQYQFVSDHIDRPLPETWQVDLDSLR